MGCNKCGSKVKCNCACSGTPYYQLTDVCVEDHCQKIYQPQFSFSVCPVNSWNIPLCGQTAILTVPGLYGATVGSFLWHPQFGYFEINSIDTVNGTIGITNNCVEGNASAGAQVPACTCFIVTDPPVDISTQTGDCLAVDFTAPEENVPLDITLTSTQGITGGNTIQIGTGFYFVQEVKPDNIITIVNKGFGIIPGTPVIALDADGNPQYCISIISTNPCDKDHINEGIVLVCDGNGDTVPVKSLNQGWVLTAINPGDDVAAFRPAGSVTCTTLTADLNLLVGVATYANVAVADSSIFTVGDVLEIEGGVGNRFLITAIPDATHIDITVSPVPGGGILFPSGSILCLGNCCEQIAADLACVVQGSRFSIDPIFQITGVGGVPAVVYAGQTGGGTLGEIFEYTAPNDCPGSTYRLEAVLNVSGLANHDNGIIGFEFKAAWSNNLSEGRMNWVDFGSDGFDIGGAYPAGPLDPIWDILTDAADLFPMMYHTGYIIVSTIVASGATVTLNSNYKWIIGDNNAPTALTRVSFYVIGNLNVTKIT